MSARAWSVVVAAAFGAGHAAATGYTYVGPFHGNWSNGANWSPLGVPGGGPSDFAVVPAGEFVILDLGCTIDRLGIGAGGAVQVASNRVFTIRGQIDGLGNTGTVSIEQGGTLSLDHNPAVGGTTDLALAGGAGHWVVAGSGVGAPGRILLNNGSPANRVYGVTAQERFVIGCPLEGAGQLGLNTLSFEVQTAGSINAIPGAAGGELVLDAGGAGVLNNNFIGATGAGGVLRIANSVVTNQGAGRVRADGGGAVILMGATINGGRVTNAGGAIYGIADSVLDAVTLDGAVTIPSNNRLFLRTSLTNNNIGYIDIDHAPGNGGSTDLAVLAPTTIAGPGGLRMSNAFGNRVYANNGADRITFVNTNIRGGGQLGVGSAALTFDGTFVTAPAGATLSIQPNGLGVINNGTVRTEPGGLINVYGAWDNTAGQFIAADTTTIDMYGAAVTGGTLGAGGSGIYRPFGSTNLIGVTANAPIAIGTNHRLNLTNSLANNAALTIDHNPGNGGTTDLAVLTPIVIAGTGSIQMSDSSSNRIYANNGADQITLDQPVRGAGQVGVGSARLVLNAPVENNRSQTLFVQPNGLGCTNNSVVRALTGPVQLQGVYANGSGLIEAMAGQNVTGNGCRINGGTVNAGAGAEFTCVNSVTLDAVTLSGTTRLPSNHRLNLVSSVMNNGTILLDHAPANGGATDLAVMTPLALAGTGSIQMSDSNANRVYANNGADLIAVNQPVRGAGQIGAGSARLVFNALVENNRTALLTISPNGNGCENNSTVRAATGPLSIHGVIDNTDGVIETTGAQHVTLVGPNIAGGVLRATGAGEFQMYNSARMTGVTFAQGAMRLLTNHSFRLSGTNTIDGTLIVDHNPANGGSTDVVGIGPIVVAGSGVIQMSDTAANRIYSSNGVDLVAFGPGLTVRGAGQIGVGSAQILNQGTIEATGANAIVINPNGSGFASPGTMRAAGAGGIVLPNGAPMTLTGTTVVDAGSILSRSAGTLTQTGGSTIVNGSMQVASGFFSFSGGAVGGSGVINCNVLNAGGTLTPGASPGVLTINGTYTQAGSGVMEVEIGGEGVGTQHDQLSLSGNSTLDGTLRIIVAPGYVPTLGAQHVIVNHTSGTRTGGFANVEVVGAEPGVAFAPFYLAGSVVIGVTSTTCSGIDFNQDGLFPDNQDIEDFLSVFGGGACSTGVCQDIDFNNDGLFPDNQDLQDFFDVFGGGSC
ncbi:MAG TPA: hypothetical protein VD971_09045 [Phycisphaerales bacterium]|nr:hypothetical protein [Phycisphaerales bacterium]